MPPHKKSKRGRKSVSHNTGGAPDTSIFANMNQLDINTGGAFSSDFSAHEMTGAGYGPNMTYPARKDWPDTQYDAYPVRAVLTYYRSTFCGTCAWFNLAWESFIQEYESKRNAYVANLNAGKLDNDVYPDIIEHRIVYVNTDDPTYLPPGVDSVPTIMLSYIDEDGKVLSSVKKYSDIYADATANWLNQPVSRAMGLHILYDWLPSSLDTVWPGYADLYPGLDIFNYLG